MRAMVQRVLSARVEVDQQIVAQIGPGLLVFVGFKKSDAEADAEFICRKILNMQIFENGETGESVDESVLQRNYEVLLVSQFSLYGVFKGNRPDFHEAMPSHLAKPFYAALVERFCQTYSTDRVKDGLFGVKRLVYLVNDGPMAIQIDSFESNNEDN